jgi:hypothetical protein
MTRMIVLLLTGVIAPASSALQAETGEAFPIAANGGNEFALAAAFDGRNYLVAICGDDRVPFAISAQLVSSTGEPVSAKVSTGRIGWLPFVAFDGMNYLLVWQDGAAWPSNVIYGQFVDTAGSLVGPPFPISGASSYAEPSGVAFDGANYLVIWEDMQGGNNEAVYGHLVSRTGDLVGSRIRISGNSVDQNQAALAFDGNNYLVVWTDGSRLGTRRAEDIYGQFVRPSGQRVGSEFVIEQNSYSSDNTIATTFDGSNYLVVFHDRVNGQWNIYARPVSSTGQVGPRVTISDAPGNQEMPFAGFVAFDGTYYLLSMADSWGEPVVTARGRYLDTELNPVGDWFTLFEAEGARVPFGASVLFGQSQFLAVTTRAEYTPDGDIPFRGADVYGAFIESPGDLDKDGVPNSSDNCPVVSNPGQADRDADGVGDLCDNCAYRYNPNQPDSDRDGRGDACECLRIIPADLNGDCYVNWTDLAIFMSQWLECGNPSDPACY